MNDPQTRLEDFSQRARPSPIADLIQRHRAEVARIWQRHEAELRQPQDRAA
jgi:hypothetical protein